MDDTLKIRQTESTNLNPEQVEFYKTNGYLTIPGAISKTEIDRMKAELPRLFAAPGPQRVFEDDGVTIRSVYGCHLESDFWGQIVRDRRLLIPARQLIGDDVYVYQFKINVKAAQKGDIWEWHQDYVFWLEEDGMPSPQAMTASIFLDDVNEENGPLSIVPGSHRTGPIVHLSRLSQRDADWSDVSRGANSPGWTTDLTASLKYSISPDVVERLINSNGIAVPMGIRGTVLFFHPNVIHGSKANRSEHNRTTALITYNGVHNAPTFPKTRRPAFLVSSDNSPLKPQT